MHGARLFGQIAPHDSQQGGAPFAVIINVEAFSVEVIDNDQVDLDLAIGCLSEMQQQRWILIRALAPKRQFHHRHAHTGRETQRRLAVAIAQGLLVNLIAVSYTHLTLPTSALV